ncbi:glycosyltransferase family 39 protein [Actinomadura terrae]|uniref:glycosyltransferase family 39 protein n=1 Tax=Actinomadura terrae TaxID=604353 RepID=UPI002343171C|nr:glycosyltransferase family 39 protein [Actinomadura terrae]
MTATQSTGTQSPAVTSGPARREGARHVRRLVLGPPDDPRWARPALWALLVAAAVLYGWGLSESGYANSYYSAAVRSGTQSWKAFFFGSLDAGSFITVDKPPMALWVMGLFARVMGFGTWSLLLPQVIEGVAAVAVLYAAVRRAFGPAAAVLAAAALTLTPITVAINRDNNPDTLLVLLLVSAAWACQRAVEGGRVRFLLLAAFLVGCGFNTKMLQAFLVVPAFALAYLVAGRAGALRRAVHLGAAGAVLAVASLWWTLVVDALPADRRPFVGGSGDGTMWDLIVGYNGLGRVFGVDGERAGGRAGAGAAFGGEPGAGRLFGDLTGGQISWLVPLAVLACAAGLVLLRGRPRTDPERAALLLWGGWLAVHCVVFSFAKGLFHPYYSTAMAPAIAALVGGGGVLLVRAYRRSAAWAWVLPAGVAATGAWAFVLLDRTPSWHPWLRWTVAAATVLAVAGLAAGRASRRAGLPAIVAGLVLALAAGLSGPGAFAVSTASGRTNGSDPMAGPARKGRGGLPAALPTRRGAPGGVPPGRAPEGFPRPPGGMLPGGAGGPGGPGGGVSPEMTGYLMRNQGSATWLVAVPSGLEASALILRTGRPVMAMGGFTGRDPAITVAKLRRHVEEGRLRYVLVGGGGVLPDLGSAEVTAWVERNGTPVGPREYGGAAASGMPGGRLYRLGAS